MKIKIRLYKVHDYDLCKLYIAQPKGFSYKMKEALVCYFRKAEFTPGKWDTCKKPPASIHEIRISLDDEKDSDVIAALNNIIPRQRNSFIKNLFRRYLDLDSMSMMFVENTDFSIASNITKTKVTSKLPTSTAVKAEKREEKIVKEVFSENKPKEEVTINRSYSPPVKEDSLDDDEFDLFGTAKMLIGE